MVAPALLYTLLLFSSTAAIPHQVQVQGTSHAPKNRHTSTRDAFALSDADIAARAARTPRAAPGASFSGVLTAVWK